MSVKINTEVIEMMLFFWQSISEREKVSEDYIRSVAERDEMKYTFCEGFNEESVRKVLSAISNNELLSDASKEEKKFWNNNMWMTEDLGVVNMMVEPIKKLNLDGIDSNKTLIFVPGHLEEKYIDGDTIVVNFFKINVDIFGGTGAVTVNGKDFKDYILDLVQGK
ncbi:hypothetical protein [Fenollaria massiliensis]|uniref:Uncharacterized protein n=1 Tax=Fenollaria massiliensis TaxID=938288 RepID=A0A9E7ITG2_9FIRM|nr:hypothetical protein [Fenollaria massiliensis]UQK58523.1 hypothetical protein M1R53_04600 [Fenollaria massiliensis]